MPFEPLKKWFLSEKRDLPWRNNPTPYAVWVSEVMLQQTQASVVIPYYESWMRQFPSIEKLAEAPISTVIKAWEGLGYYSRARNLHEGARYVVANHQGKLPETEQELQKIKGLGPYTIGAIRSFAFHQHAAAVDGNVLRVLTRYLLIQEDISKAKTVKNLRRQVLEILPQEESWIVNEALIELGATICAKKPKCGQCPLKKTCKGFAHGVAASLPIKSAKIKVELLLRNVAIITSNQHVLLKVGQPGEIMQDLYEFPYFEKSEDDFLLQCENKLSLRLQQEKTLEMVSQSFTRYRVKLFPYLFSCNRQQDVPGYIWLHQDILKGLPFSSGHRKIYTLCFL